MFEEYPEDKWREKFQFSHFTRRILFEEARRELTKRGLMKQWHWFVYIIECKDSLYYTGMTYDLDKRLEQHRIGKGGIFTSKHGFKRLCYFEEFTDITEARNREHQLKDFSRKKKEELWK